MAILFLPRQFQVAVIENINEDHLNKAIWLFPLYLLAINLFVLPIALAGRLRFPVGEVDADFMVLLLPMVEHQHLLTLFTFLGGLSAATAMVIVATVALSTMLCNDLIMPVLLRLRFLRLNEQPDLSGLLLTIRRGSILGMLLLGYAYFRIVGESYALVTMGLVSFCAAAQFAPPILFGIYWKAATLRGALTGLCAGFLIWLYTLLLPALARSGWVDAGFVSDGLFGFEILKPYALFGVSGLDPVSHSLLWSLLANVAGLVGWSLLGRQGSFERVQASLFVDVDRLGGGPHVWRGSAPVADLRALLARYVGAERAGQALARHARTRGLALAADAQADADLVNFAERLLAGAIGAASARVMISTVVKSADFSPDEVMAILDEASQVIEYSRQLEQKSQALEITSEQLRRVNQRLTELDRLKDEFISTVSHELRTPLTSIRSFSEILLDNPELAVAQRNQFLDIVVKESERLTRLINDILDLSRIGSGQMEWHLSSCDPKEVIADALAATDGLFRAKQIRVEPELGPELPRITVDRDRLMQVVINLLSNAAKFVQAGSGRVKVSPRGRGPRPRGQRPGQRPRYPARAGPGGVREVPSARQRPDDRQARGLGPGARDLPADHRALRRPDLGRAGGAARGRVPLHPAGRRPGGGRLAASRPGSRRRGLSPGPCLRPRGGSEPGSVLTARRRKRIWPGPSPSPPRALPDPRGARARRAQARLSARRRSSASRPSMPCRSITAPNSERWVTIRLTPSMITSIATRLWSARSRIRQSTSTGGPSLRIRVETRASWSPTALAPVTSKSWPP